MPTMPMAGQSRKQGRKKARPAKKQWRTGVGNTIAKEVLNSKAAREKERRVFGFAADEATDEQLFVIDKDTDGAAGLTTSKKLLKRKAALKSEAILRPNMRIPTIGKAPIPHAGLAAAPVKKERSQEQLTHGTRKLLGKLAKKAEIKKANGVTGPRVVEVKDSYNLWGSDVQVTEPKADANGRGVSAQRTALKRNRLIGSDKKRPSAGKLGTRRPAAAEATASVEVADAGASYNPDTELHQELIGEALVQARARRGVDRKLKKMTWNKQRVLRGKDPSEMLGDYLSGPVLTEEEQLVANEQLALEWNNGEGESHRPVEWNKKTISQRNKIARQKVRHRPPPVLPML